MEAAADLGLDRSSPDVMEISGDRGGRISRVEELSRGKAGVGLTLQFRSGIACGVGLEGRRLGVNANFEAMEISRCSTGRGPDDEESADVGWGEHLAGLQVCSSRSEPLTVGGFEIEMAEVDAEGVHSHRTKETGLMVPCVIGGRVGQAAMRARWPRASWRILRPRSEGATCLRALSDCSWFVDPYWSLSDGNISLSY